MRSASVQQLVVDSKHDEARGLRRELLKVLVRELDPCAAEVVHAGQIEGDLYQGAGEIYRRDEGIQEVSPVAGTRISDTMAERIYSGASHNADREACCHQESNSWVTTQFKRLDRMVRKEESENEVLGPGLEVLVYSNHRLVGRIALWCQQGDGSWNERDHHQLDEIIGTYHSQLENAAKLQRDIWADRAGMLLMRPDGQITHITDSVERWFTEDDADRLFEYARNVGFLEFEGTHFLLGAAAEVQALNGLDCQPVFLVELSPPSLPHIRLEYVLTPAQQEVARLAADGYSSDEIADKLIRSPHTIQTHLRNIYRRLGINSRYELMCLDAF